MEPLALDPAGFHGTYKLVGGQSSLDLVNTLAWPGTDREHDWLEPVSNVTAWAAELALIDQETRQRLEQDVGDAPVGSATALARVRQIRETLRSALAPLARSEALPTDAVEALNRVLGAVCSRRRIDPETGRWSWVTPRTLEEVMAPVIWNAAEVLTGTDPSRLGRCPSCDWLFHDTTRNRSRRWCDMADCGSRDKALRYYHRNKP